MTLFAHSWQLRTCDKVSFDYLSLDIFEQRFKDLCQRISFYQVQSTLRAINVAEDSVHAAFRVEDPLGWIKVEPQFVFVHIHTVCDLKPWPELNLAELRPVFGLRYLIQLPSFWLYYWVLFVHGNKTNICWHTLFIFYHYLLCISNILWNHIVIVLMASCKCIFKFYFWAGLITMSPCKWYA